MKGENPLIELMMTSRGHPFRPAADVCYPRDQSRVIVTFEIPGVRVDVMKIAVTERTLTIEGTRKHKGPVGKFFHHMEIDYGYFRRKLTLPFEVDSAALNISYEDGFLTLDLPAEAKSKSDKTGAEKIG